MIYCAPFSEETENQRSSTDLVILAGSATVATAMEKHMQAPR
jgi:hypothetical protein